MPAAPAASVCPACHADLSAGARFCKSCGVDLRVCPDNAPPAQAAPPEARSGNNAPRVGLVVALLLLIVIVGVAFYFVVGKSKVEETVTETPAAVVIPPASKTPSETMPQEAAEEIAPPPESDSQEAGEQQTQQTAPTPVTTKKPAEPRPERAERAPAESEPKPVPTPPRKSCDGLKGFPALLCRTEGASRFWRCVPDGVNWDNDIPGCQRDTSRNDRLY
jgi:hypothetical protein